MQNRIKKTSQYFYIYSICTYMHTPVQKPMVFLKQSIQLNTMPLKPSIFHVA